MVNWKEVSDLHVIKKLEHIIARWFGVELYYTNEHGKLESDVFQSGHEFQNFFMKVQAGAKYGHEYLSQDIEKVTEKLFESNDNSVVYDSFCTGLKGIAAKIHVDGEYSGTVFAYPFISDQFTKDDEEKLKQKMIEGGAVEADVAAAIKGLKEWRSQKLNTSNN